MFIIFLEFLEKRKKGFLIFLYFLLLLNSLEVNWRLFIFFGFSFELLSAFFIFIIEFEHELYLHFRSQNAHQISKYLSFHLIISFLLSFKEFFSLLFEISLFWLASNFVGKVLSLFLEGCVHVFLLLRNLVNLLKIIINSLCLIFILLIDALTKFKSSWRHRHRNILILHQQTLESWKKNANTD